MTASKSPIDEEMCAEGEQLMKAIRAVEPFDGVSVGYDNKWEWLCRVYGSLMHIEALSKLRNKAKEEGAA